MLFWKILGSIFIIHFFYLFFFKKNHAKIDTYIGFLSLIIAIASFTCSVWKEENVSNENNYIMKTNTVVITNINNITTIETLDYIEYDNLWLKIKSHLRKEEYDEVIDIATNHNLLETEKMLNIQGVMYAKGYYYEYNLENALKCFKSAAEYGTLDYTYKNLFLAAFWLDIISHNHQAIPINYWNLEDVIKIAEKDNNIYFDKIIRKGAWRAYNVTVFDGYEYFKQLTWDEKSELLSSLMQNISHKYIEATDYNYYRDNNGKTIAKTSEFQEFEFHLYALYTQYHFTFIDDIQVNSTISFDPILIETFEYSTHYIDSNGKIQFWEQTDEYYYGNIPPQDGENFRWVISSYDETQNTRIFVKEIKHVF